MQQSMQLAATRERLLWIAAYYSTFAALSRTRLAVLRRALPAGATIGWDQRFLLVNQLLICMPPFMAGYQLDYALFSKSDKIYAEAESIRNAEGPHRWFGQAMLPSSDDRELWFNQPVQLPSAMRPAYEKMKRASDAELAKRGLPAKRDWARFDQPRCDSD